MWRPREKTPSTTQERRPGLRRKHPFGRRPDVGLQRPTVRGYLSLVLRCVRPSLWCSVTEILGNSRKHLLCAPPVRADGVRLWVRPTPSSQCGSFRHPGFAKDPHALENVFSTPGE